jgi:Domain of unknown function (DUF397)
MEGWRKSTYSDGNGGNCIETASGDGVVLVRDTANRDGGTLAFTADTWRAFAAKLKRALPLAAVSPRGTRQLSLTYRQG